MLGLVEEVFAEVTAPRPSPAGATAAAAEFHRLLPKDVQTAVGSPVSTAQHHALQVLTEAGLSSPMQQMAALSVARLPTLAAEAIAVPRGDVRGYPMELPAFDYQPPPVDEHD